MNRDMSNTNDSTKSPFQGFLLIDKPAGMTSHDVVDRVRRLTGERRVGHAGTLDPFATGLLIVGVGRVATREMQKLVGLDKVYEAVFILGASSTTDDTEGEITPAPINLEGSRGLQPAPDRRLKPAATTIEEALKQFIGEIEQVPPTYSAIKIKGKKMYEAAREGKPMEAKARPVTIYSIVMHSTQRLHDSTTQQLSLTIHCSSGTYIRSLARDLGRALGGGGYVEQLRRTKIGPFSIENATSLSALPALSALPLIPVSDLLSRVLTNASPDANLLSA